MNIPSTTRTNRSNTPSRALNSRPPISGLSSFRASNLRSLLCAGLLVAATWTPQAAYSIVTDTPASATPASDPHIVDGGVDVDDLVNGNLNLPVINPDGVVQLKIFRQPEQADGSCTGALVHTSQGTAVLTAAQCVASSSVKQITADITVEGQRSPFATCNTAT